jgi:hypothetical protein
MEAHMQVKLCARCPYTPDDLATHYEPKGALHLCAKCDSEEEEKKDAQQLALRSAWQSKALRGL